ncbi:MAG TPA: SpoIIE family protein phosphatase, partial [Elusimicrobiales bacterium]|nr:SpoIIE family protein phosphatase [Elusimicrobiales bacterium]
GLARDAKLDLYETELKPGDRLLLCTDGLFKAISDEAFFEALSQTQTPQETCDKLVAMANAGGGPDNITVIVLDVSGTAPLPEGHGTPDENAHPEVSAAKKPCFLSRLFCGLFGCKQD